MLGLKSWCKKESMVKEKNILYGKLTIQVKHQALKIFKYFLISATTIGLLIKFYKDIQIWFKFF